MTWPNWQPGRGRDQIGPHLDEAEAVPVRVVREAWEHPANPRQAGALPQSSPLTGHIADPNLEIFQIRASHAYDTLLVTVHDRSLTLQNQLVAYLDQKLSYLGVGNYPNALVIPRDVPDYAGAPFGEWWSGYLSLVYGTVPVWLALPGSSGTDFLVTVTLMTLGA